MWNFDIAQEEFSNFSEIDRVLKPFHYTFNTLYEIAKYYL